MQVVQPNPGSTREVEEYHRPVTRKGTVTLPVEVRRLFSIKPQSKVTFRVVGKTKVELLPSLTLEETFGSVRPKTKPLDLKALRDEAIEAKVRRFNAALNN